MSRRLFNRINQLPLALTVLGVVGSGCGLRETRSNSATSLAGMQRVNSAGAISATPKVSVQLDEIRKQLRDATEFWKLSLAQESKERKEADEAIRSDVLALGEKLEALRGFLNSEVARLDKTLRDEFVSKLAEQENKLSLRIQKEAAERTATIEALDKKTNDALNKLSTETQKSIQDTRNQLADAETKLKQAINDLSTAQQTSAANQLQKLMALETNLNKNIQDVANGLVEQLKSLESRTNLNAADLKKDILSKIASNKTDANEQFKKLQGELSLANLALVRQAEQLDSQISALKDKTDTQSMKISKELTEAKNRIGAKIADLELVTRGELNNVRTKLENSIMDSEAALSDLITMAREEAHSNLVKVVGETKATLVGVMSEADKKLREELSQKIASESQKQMEALLSFKKEVDATYAKQADLVALQNVVNGLSNALSTLDTKVSDNDKRLEKSIKDLRTDLVGQIGRVEASVTSLRTDFSKHVKAYDSKVQELAEQTRDAAKDLRRELASAAAYDLQARDRLAESIEKLNGKLTNTEDFAIKTRDALAGKIVELERRDGELTNEVRNARKDATAELSAAIAKEQQARQAIANDVKALQAEVERVSSVATQALSLSKANQLAIAGVQSDLEVAKKDWKEQLAKLRTDMQVEMDALRQDSQAIMQGLGLSAQAHFTETTTQLKDVNGKISGLMIEMGRAVQKGILQSIDPAIKSEANAAAKAKEFNDEVSVKTPVQVNGQPATLQQYASNRMDEFTKVLGRIEAEFLLAIDYAEVLNDAQKTRDLRAMNQSFIDRVVNLSNGNQKVCSAGDAGKIVNGVPHLMASANGHEFWAHLARAYAHLVVSGGRSGDGKDGEYDKMFFGAPAVADGKSFQSALALASSPSLAHGADAGSGQCIGRIEDWAKSVLFGGTPESTRLRAALRARTGLEAIVRAGGMLEQSYKDLKDPAERIEAVAKAKLSPAFQNNEAKLLSYLRSGDGKSDPGFYASASQIINEYSILLAQQRALNHNFAALTNAALEARKVEQAENVKTKPSFKQKSTCFSER